MLFSALLGLGLWHCCGGCFCFVCMALHGLCLRIGVELDLGFGLELGLTGHKLGCNMHGVPSMFLTLHSPCLPLLSFSMHEASPCIGFPMHITLRCTRPSSLSPFLLVYWLSPSTLPLLSLSQITSPRLVDARGKLKSFELMLNVVFLFICLLNFRTRRSNVTFRTSVGGQIHANSTRLTKVDFAPLKVDFAPLAGKPRTCGKTSHSTGSMLTCTNTSASRTHCARLQIEVSLWH